MTVPTDTAIKAVLARAEQATRCARSQTMDERRAIADVPALGEALLELKALVRELIDSPWLIDVSDKVVAISVPHSLAEALRASVED